jgi:VTC domain-containing protein
VKVGGINEVPKLSDVLRRASRGPRLLPRTSDAYYPASAERRADHRAPLHFQRIELKYFLPYRWLDHFIERVSRRTNVDPWLVKEGMGRVRYPVTSLYFDSYDLSAWDEKENGQFFRRKIRLRAYHDEFSKQSPCFLEIKRRLDAVVIKDRIGLPPGILTAEVPVNRLMPYLLSKAREQDPTALEAHMMLGWLNLQPAAIVRYQRYALVAKEDPNTRITIDHHIQGVWKPPAILGDVPMRAVDNLNPTGMNAISGKYALLEIKSNNVIPGWLHQVIQDMELSRTAYSKYYLVVLALRPSLLEDCDELFAS